MLTFGLVMIMAVSLYIAIQRAARPGGYIEYPFLFTVVVVGWIAPQLWYVVEDTLLPPDAVEKLLLVVLLSIGAVVVGWRLGTKGAAPSGVTPRPPVRVIIPLTIALTSISFAIDSLLFVYRDQWIEDGGGQQATGMIPVLAFFGAIRIVPLWLSAHLFLRDRTPVTMALLAVNLVGTGTIAFVLMRRSEMIDFFYVLLTALWFTRRLHIPRPVFLAGILLITPVMYSIGALRGASLQVMKETGQEVGLLSLETLSRVDFTKSTIDSASKAPDLTNAVALISYTERWDQHTLGASTWNRIVWQYVPAIVFGPELKRALRVESVEGSFEQIEADTGYVYKNGTTPTGFGFVYQEFGWLGPLYFMVISFIFGRVWLWCNQGDFWSVPLLASFGGLSLTSVTHAPTLFFTALPPFLLVIWACRIVTRKSILRAQRAEMRNRSRPGNGGHSTVMPYASRAYDQFRSNRGYGR